MLREWIRMDWNAQGMDKNGQEWIRMDRNAQGMDKNGQELVENG